MAQASKSAVKKKILEIRRGGARAADEILDQLLLSDNKKANKGKNTQNSEFTVRFGAVLSKYRAKWRNFIVEAAVRCDPDALACFGTNLIYGGLMTSSYGGAAFASLLKLEEARRSASGHEAFSKKESSAEIDRSREISGLLSRGRMRGNMVWVISGREAFSPQMLKKLPLRARNCLCFDGK